jgi:hypothetical protein
VELIVWHEPKRITHAEAAAKTSYEAHPSVAAFAGETEGSIVGGDRTSYVVLSIKDSAVPAIRYLAAKHRLVCYEPGRQAVLNPPLLRRSDAYELGFCVGHSIDDPSPEHLAAAVHALTEQNWFLVLNDGDEHFVQVARSHGTHLMEYKEEGLFQTEVAEAAAVIEALCDHAAGAPWRDRFQWRSISG